MSDLHLDDERDTIKMLRETFSAAQSYIGTHSNRSYDRGRHVERLQRLIDECERQRPTGSDGKHADRHTPTCGCDDTGAGPTEQDGKR